MRFGQGRKLDLRFDCLQSDHWVIFDSKKFFGTVRYSWRAEVFRFAPQGQFYILWVGLCFRGYLDCLVSHKFDFFNVKSLVLTTPFIFNGIGTILWIHAKFKSWRSVKGKYYNKNTLWFIFVFDSLIQRVGSGIICMIRIRSSNLWSRSGIRFLPKWLVKLIYFVFFKKFDFYPELPEKSDPDPIQIRN